MKREENQRNKKSGKKGITHEMVDQAMKDYLQSGGKIKVIEPLWLEEGSAFSGKSP